ncbi:MAG: ATP-binding cassette domain-containing protein [Ignavibacteria bacterium]|nr:ATP-binding cassette domain-containing protein [Ignavibacteria bacterium]
MIEIKGLRKSFEEKVVLNGVDMSIPNGSTTCIIGRSGCGKSVLLKHIVGLLIPDSGTVKVDGMEISSLSNFDLFQLRRKIGFVFQGSALFDSYNVFENIVIGLYEHGLRDNEKLESEAMRVLSAVGLLPEKKSDAAVFEREWKILKEKKPSDLSGGMKKRVGVARALVGEPSYIFYDEPTTGLDPVTSRQIDQLIANLSKKLKITSLVITHDMFSVFEVADSVAMLEGGVVRFFGNATDLKESKDEKVIEFLSRYN